MKLHYLVPVVMVLLAGCGPKPGAVEVPPDVHELAAAERGFMDRLASLCGQSFRGRQVYMAEGRESWEDKVFVMHVTRCERDLVLIPFHLSADHSRTWMFINENGRLRFRHDHRHPDGTPETKTLYGGYGDGTGTEYAQQFPKDEYSRALLEGTHGREWRVVMNEEMTTFSYQLLYAGRIVFQADFDLTRPLGEMR